MSKQDIQKELDKLNKEIDKLIIDEKTYKHLTARHALLWDLLQSYEA